MRAVSRLAVVWSGKRVELQPWMDAWMAGDRYGTIVKVGRLYAYVQMDRSGITRRVQPSNLRFVD